MTLRKTIAALAVTAGALAAAAPASASLTVTATGQNIGNPTGTSTVLMNIECAAAGGAVTEIEACWLEGLFNGQRFNAPVTGLKPGPVDAAAFTFTVPIQPYKACVRASGMAIDTGNFETVERCFT